MFSRRDNDDAPTAYRKPRADLYTVLLVLALLAILLGILCLYLDMKVYDFNIRGAPTLSQHWQTTPLRIGAETSVAFRSAKECGFRGAKDDNA